MLRLVNPLVIAILRSRAHWLISRHVALLAVTGRRSGEAIYVPVDYRRDGDRLLIRTRRARNWWRNLRALPEANVTLQGTEVPVAAELSVEGDAVHVTLTRKVEAQATG
jgi:deazaflavin-dependent oxidoreductase (nitroreductase family)